jgi:hypothetical protein
MKNVRETTSLRQARRVQQRVILTPEMEVRVLREAVVEALASCWEGKLPFAVLERALRR